MITSCVHPFRLEVLDPDEIPEPVRRAAGSDKQDLAWRAAYAQNNYHVYVFTHRLDRTGTLIEMQAFREGPDGQLERIGGVGGGPLSLGNTVWHQGQVSGGQPGRLRGYQYAAGWALRRDAYKVVGQTTLGREFEAIVSGGFWTIPIFDDATGLERFERVVLYNEKDKVLHTYVAPSGFGSPR